MRFIDLFANDPEINKPREAKDTQERLKHVKEREWKANGIKEGIQDAVRRVCDGNQ
jgi:hypothetical protein